MKALWFAVFLSGVLMFGINYQAFDSYKRYGWRYEITTTINGVSSVQEISFVSQFVTSLMFDYLFVVLIYLVISLNYPVVREIQNDI